MFEITGLIFATGLLFFLSGSVGLVLGLVAWFILRGQSGLKKLWVLPAVLLPIACAGYMVFCAVIFTFFVPGAKDTLFGDFDEPLPNGYLLKGLAKMPDFAYIESIRASDPQPQLLGNVAALNVDGSIVFGRYSHEFGSFDAPVAGGLNYFTFDTRTREVGNFASQLQLDQMAGHPLTLIEPQLFHSHEPAIIRMHRLENFVYLFPPISIIVLYFAFLLHFRRNPSKLTKILPD